jgi:hypothetical protein
MDTTPPDEQTPKDYSTRRIDLENLDIAGEQAASEPEKKSRTRKTASQPDVAAAPAPALTKPIVEQPLPPPPPPPPPPALPPALPETTPKNDRIWIAAIVCISVVVLACLCSCTIVAAFFLGNPPW